MVAPSRSPHADHADDHEVELWKEGFTMALYVAVCLLAALAAVSEPVGTGHLSVYALVWGTTLGLALAHWFAFRVSARLVAAGAVRRHDAVASAAQLVGATSVALLVTVPLLVFPSSVELDVVRLVLAAFIALVGYAVARSSGAGQLRSLVYGASVLLVAAVVAIGKNVLAGH